MYAALQAGQVTTPEAELLIATVVNLGNATASTLADVYVSAQIEQATGIPTPVVGIPPVDGVDRLTAAAHTILDDLRLELNAAATAEGVESGDVPDPTRAAGLRFERLARAEPLETAQQFSVDMMAAQPLVEGWTRQMDSDPCQLCVWWWREGRVWPKVHPFQSHKGCNCQPKVVLTENIESTEYSRSLRNAG